MHNNNFLDGLAWGLGKREVGALAYAGEKEGASAQIVAYHSHLMLLETLRTTPPIIRIGCALYHDAQAVNFCVIGWEQSVFTIEMPLVDRSN